MTNGPVTIQEFERAIANLQAFYELAYKPEHKLCKPIGTLAAITCVLLTVPANNLDGKHRVANLPKSGVMGTVMPGINRFFLNGIHSEAEGILKKLCDENSYDVEISSNNRAKGILERLSDKLGKEEIEKIKDEISDIEGMAASTTPSFSDYLSAVLKNTSLTKAQKTVQRKLFNALSIIRNKVSHFDCSLGVEQVADIKSAGLKALVNNGEIFINPNHFKELCESISSNLSYIEDNLK